MTIRTDALDRREIRRDIDWLTDEARQGRGVGTDGLEASAHYIATRFKALRLKPAPGLEGYYQPFEVRVGSALTPASGLLVNAEPVDEAAFVPLAWSGEGAFEGDVVFAGYAISDADQNYNDFAGIDVKGKPVLAMRYEPHTADGKSRFTGDTWSRNAVLFRKAQAAAVAGASALLLVDPPEHHTSDGLMSADGRRGFSVDIPVYHVTQAVAEAILGGEGSLAALQKQIDETGEPATRLTQTRVSGEVGFEPRRVDVRNVVAVLPGRGELADEYVVVGAHYDHLGMGGFGSRAPGVTAVHPGADDNASGTAALLEVAEQLARAGRRERSILFVAFSAEEIGLIGSRLFVRELPVPPDSIVAMVNLDMIGRIRNDRLLIGGHGTAEMFRQWIDEADAESPLNFHNLGRGGTGPSDHASFAAAGIPVLFFFSGLHPDYHTPADTADTVNIDGIAQVVEFVYAVVADIAAGPRQAYVADFDGEGLNLDWGEAARGENNNGDDGAANNRADDQPPAQPPIRVTLGVTPSYESGDSTDGLLIDGISDDSPAAAAGLKPGDVIVNMNDTAIKDIYGLTAFLRDAEPGDEVRITVRRDGATQTLTTNLAARGRR
ncbi:MAG: M20/M25/M40 family metallo-hydrolase [Phycisphaerae bacterium]